MKKFITTIATLFIAVFVIAQVPQTINYQAVARNNNGQALVNQNIKVRFSILSSTTTSYTETWAVTTNPLGLFNVQIGSNGATNIIGDFTEIHWDQLVLPKLKVELDLNNSGVFTTMGTQDLSSIPYSFYAGLANDTKNLGGLPVSIPAIATGNVLTWNGTQWTAGSSVKPIIQNNFGAVGSLASNSTAWVRVGPQPPVTDVVAGQTIIGSFTVTLGTSAGTTPYNVGICVCYQQCDNAGNPVGAVSAFYPTTFPETTVGTRGLFSANGVITVTATGTSGTIAPGKYRFFLGVRNNTLFQLNNNDYVNGFVTIQ